MKSAPNVLSIMEDILGHRTYGQLIREYFREKSDFIDFYWFTDERDLFTKILCRPFHTFFPNRWIQKQNLDFSRFRVQLAMSYTVRCLLARKLKQKDYALLHLHTQGISLLSLDFMKEIPTVVGLDITAVQASQEKTNPKFRWTYKPNIWLEKKIYDLAVCIISFSEHARKSVIEDYGINPNKVIVIPPGVNSDSITMPNSSQKPIDIEPCRILFVGGDFERKGGEDLLEVFLSNFAESAELHLVTNDSITCDHPNVYIHKNIKAYTPQWLNLYHKSDIFVMPTYAEAFGHVFLEAMSAGLPVIATKINAVPEMVIHEKTGFLIQPGDQFDLKYRMGELLKNPTLRHEMGLKGRQIIEEKFDKNVCFKKLELKFQEILAGNFK